MFAVCFFVFISSHHLSTTYKWEYGYLAFCSCTSLLRIITSSSTPRSNKRIILAGHGGSRSQHFGRPRQADNNVKRLRASWPIWWNPVSTKNKKISWAWWRKPVIPATWGAETGELLEPRKQRLQWAKMAPLRSSLATEQDSVSKKKKELFCSFLWLHITDRRGFILNVITTNKW